ncbi:MAG: 4-hydroxy-3-methylbut-2-enyl diphosphate reductase, partial [Sciscionella sp.]
NSKRLVEVALHTGASASRLIDSPGEVEDSWLTGVRTVGVTSGASVPEVLVQEVLAFLAERGWTDVQEVTTANEKIAFALPRELRTDLGGART